MQEVGAVGGFRGWMQEVDAGGGCRGMDAEGGIKMWMQWVDAGGAQVDPPRLVASFLYRRRETRTANNFITKRVEMLKLFWDEVYRWIPPGWLRAWGTVGGKFEAKMIYYKTCGNA